MSLTNFKASNHPQQTAKRGALDEVDDRGTKWEFIRSLEERFGEPFTLDVAAAPHNAKAGTFYTRHTDGLVAPWYGNVWCNPPYSRVKGTLCESHLDRKGLPPKDLRCGCTATRDLGSWVGKAWEEHHRGNCSRIAMLVPANRTEQQWWQDFVEPLRDRLNHRGDVMPLRVEFLAGRMRFDQPGGWVKPKKGDRPPFGLCLLIWEDR